MHFTTASWEPKNPTMRNLCFKVLRILLLVVASFSIVFYIYFLFVHGILMLYLLLLLYCRWNWSFETTPTILPLTHHSYWEYHLLFVCMWSLNLWFFFSTWFLFLYFILYNFDCAIFTLVENSLNLLFVFYGFECYVVDLLVYSMAEDSFAYSNELCYFEFIMSSFFTNLVF